MAIRILYAALPGRAGFGGFLRLRVFLRLSMTARPPAMFSLTLGLRLIGRRQQAKIMLRMLQVIFSAHMVPLGIGVPRQGLVFFINMRNRTADFHIRAVAVQRAVEIDRASAPPSAAAPAMGFATSAPTGALLAALLH